MEFPTFLADSVLVATFESAREEVRDGCGEKEKGEKTNLRQDIVHCLARFRVVLSEHAKKSKDFDLIQRRQPAPIKARSDETDVLVRTDR